MASSKFRRILASGYPRLALFLTIKCNGVGWHSGRGIHFVSKWTSLQCWNVLITSEEWILWDISHFIFWNVTLNLPREKYVKKFRRWIRVYCFAELNLREKYVWKFLRNGYKYVLYILHLLLYKKYVRGGKMLF